MIDSGEIDNLVVQENNVLSTHAEDNCSRVMDYKSQDDDNFDKSLAQNFDVSTATRCTIQDVVKSCVFASIACAMRYNGKSLISVNGKMCAAPLKDSKIGLALRLRPTPSPNRVLDVNLCFLRKIFSEEHEIIRHAITQRTRCLHEEVPDNTIAEMLFQIILLRFTGRIY
jgi:hypothetical protein